MAVVLTEREAELLVALWHLRYLTTAQIHITWYPERTEHACACRLSRLAGARLLERAEVRGGMATSAWRLSRDGTRRLAALREGPFALYQRVTPYFLPHLLETNQIFFVLAGGEWLWERLSFEWRGSHRAGLNFREVAPTRGGIAERRNRLLRPDAIVTPRTGARLFLELDRGTEAITTSTGRTSIAGKLRSYQSYLFGRTEDRRATWYESAFPDRRPAIVLFVVPAVQNASRRQRSILAAASQVEGVHVPRVECVTADDRGALRHLCGLEDAPKAPPDSATRSPTGHSHLTPGDYQTAREFYLAAAGALKGDRRSVSHLLVHSEAFRALLQRLA